MGHYAQYRKRGSRGPFSPAATAPPPPVLSRVGDQILTTAAGGNDQGGHFDIYESHDGGNTYSLEYTQEWAAVHSEYVGSFAPPSRIKAVEVGNGDQYIGRSTDSNVLILT